MFHLLLTLFWVFLLKFSCRIVAMQGNTSCIMYSPNELKSINSSRFSLDAQVWKKIKELGINVKFRGSRGGKRNKCDRSGHSSTCHSDIRKSVRVSVGLLNSQSAHKNISKILDCQHDYRFDVLALTETWFKSDGSDKHIEDKLTLPGYSFISKPRGQRGGGLAILSSEELKLQESKYNLKFKSFECLNTILSLNSTCVHIVLIYRPPPSKRNKLKPGDFLHEFSLLLEDIVTSPGHLLVLGDFNIHWDQTNDPERMKFCNLLSTFELKQHVSGSSFTHQAGHTIDLVLTKRDDDILQSATVGDMITDHSVVSVHLNLSKPKQETVIKKCRRLRDLDLDKVAEDIERSSLSKICSDNDINDMCEAYTSNLKDILDKHAPLIERKINTRPKTPWYNEDIKAAKRLKRQHEKKWRKTRLQIDREIFTASRNKVCHMIKAAKTAHYTKQIEECDKDPKKLYAVLNSISSKPSSRKLPTGELHDILQAFSDFFVTKIENLRNVILSSVSTSSSALSCNIMEHEKPEHVFDQFVPATGKEIKEIIQNSKTTSCLLDPIPTSILKHLLPVLLPVITTIINKSLETGIFPTSFAHALVVPLLKKSSLNKEILKNYRPVSNLHFISKILEKVVQKQLFSHMSKCNLHQKMQSAYKAKHSTETALLRVVNDILCQVDKKCGTILVLLDLSAAFDTIDHATLLTLLREKFGLHGTVLQWFKSYLSNRTSSVTIDGESSRPSAGLYGVPQGSVLGPVIFTMYTSPLVNIMKHHKLSFHCYADDTQLYLSFDASSPSALLDTIAKVEACVLDIKTWMNKNLLKLNDDKTEVLIITSPYFKKQIPDLSVRVGNSSITPAVTARNIGVIFDNTLQLKSHVSDICKRAMCQIKAIASIRCYLTQQACEMLVHGFITSKLDYCNSLLAGLPKKCIKKLQHVQNIAARIVTKSRSQEATPILHKLHWLPMEQRIKFKTLLIVFKCMHDLAPPYLAELISRYTPTLNLRSSSASRLVVPHTKSMYGDRAFSCIGPRWWNDLPSEIRTLNNFNEFKTCLKSHLFKEYFE